MAPVSINLSCLHRQKGFCEFLWRQWSPLSLFCQKPIQRLPKTAPDNDQLKHLELIFIDIMQSPAECSSPWVWLGGSCSNLFACKIICFCSETSRPQTYPNYLDFCQETKSPGGTWPFGTQVELSRRLRSERKMPRDTRKPAVLCRA